MDFSSKLYLRITGTGEASWGNILKATSRECEVTLLFTSLVFSVSVPSIEGDAVNDFRGEGELAAVEACRS